MNQKVGRNDPCPCGSGKKYKQCCLANERPVTGLKKFKAKVISAGGMHKPQPVEEAQPDMSKAMADYNTLMERSFGTGIHAEEAPPVPENPTEFLTKE